MFAKISAIFLFATAVLAVNVRRDDIRQEVTVRHVQLANEDNQNTKRAYRSPRETPWPHSAPRGMKSALRE